ncbi:MAG TPA: hypothetical protein VGP93_19580, partial [Polyangiaceae bacterium]|nr:hypothetical protein [Polyangiaceae bacterium]
WISDARARLQANARFSATIQRNPKVGLTDSEDTYSAITARATAKSRARVAWRQRRGVGAATAWDPAARGRRYSRPREQARS